jgi:hypothetical protein
MLRYVRYIYNDNNAAQIACQIFCRVFYKRLISHIYYYFYVPINYTLVSFFLQIIMTVVEAPSTIDCTFSFIAIFDAIS